MKFPVNQMYPSMGSKIKNIKKGRNGICKKNIKVVLQNNLSFKEFLGKEEKFGNQNKQDKIDEVMKNCTTVKLATNQLKDSDGGFDQLTAKCSR